MMSAYVKITPGGVASLIAIAYRPSTVASLMAILLRLIYTVEFLLNIVSVSLLER